MKKKIIIAMVAATILTVMYVQIKAMISPPRADSPESIARTFCVNECNRAKDSGQDISNSPCISNNIAPDWVCDVAHNPRQAVDNLPENQCSAFREGRAHHFVEVDETCGLIRAV